MSQALSHPLETHRKPVPSYASNRYCKNSNAKKHFIFVHIILPHRLTLGGIARRSPLGRVSSLLSSSTELRFSTHSGSTSPSNIIHYKNTQNHYTINNTIKMYYKYNIIRIHITESFCTSFISRLAYMHCSIKSI